MAPEAVITPMETAGEGQSADTGVQATDDSQVVQVDDDQQASNVPDQGQPEQADDPKGDHRLISQKWRDLKATNPDLYKEYTSTFFTNKEFKDKLPGGVKELDGLLGYLSENGGKDGITQKISELSANSERLTQIQELAEKGDARLLDQLPQDTVAKLGPTFDSRWQQTDFDGWSRNVARQMVGQLSAVDPQDGSSIMSKLNDLNACLRYNDVENASSLLGQIRTWVGQVGKYASSAPQQAPQQRQVSELERREAAIRDKEQAASAKEFEGRLGSAQEEGLSGELGRYLKNASSDTTRGLMQSSAKAELSSRMQADKAFQKSFWDLHNTGKTDDAAKLYASKVKDLSPGVAEYVASAFGVKARQATQQASQQQQAAQAPKADAGFKAVMQPPNPQDVDNSRTTRDMILQRKFVLRDGSKVQYVQ